jgi:hypothetical protein
MRQWPYEVRLNILHGPFELIDERGLADGQCGHHAGDGVPPGVSRSSAADDEP